LSSHRIFRLCHSSYGNLREVIQESRYCEKFFDVVPLKRCGKGQIDLARERLVREINRLGVVRGNGRSRKVNWHFSSWSC